MCLYKNLYKNFKINHLWEISPYSELVTQIVFKLLHTKKQIKNLTKKKQNNSALSEHSVWFFDLFFVSDNDYCIRHVCLFTRSLSDLPLWRDTFGHLQHAFALHIRMIAWWQRRRVCMWGGFVLPLKNSTEGLLRLKGGLCISIIHLVPCILFSTPKNMHWHQSENEGRSGKEQGIPKNRCCIYVFHYQGLGYPTRLFPLCWLNH